MSILYAAIAGATIVINGAAATADLVKARFVLKTAQEVGVPRAWIPLLGLLKGAAAVGLLLGVLGVPVIGTLSAAGLVMFFIGAIAFHMRARVFYNIAFPGFFLMLAAMSLVLSIRGF
jgi:DoxX-like family